MNKHLSKHPETKHLPDDVIHYREYKILLQPDRFTSKRGFLEFWEDANKTMAKLGLKGATRKNEDGSDYITDNGNPILDCAVKDILNPAKLERELLAIPGVVGTGLFINMATIVLVASEDGKPPRVLKPKAK